MNCEFFAQLTNVTPSRCRPARVIVTSGSALMFQNVRHFPGKKSTCQHSSGTRQERRRPPRLPRPLASVFRHGEPADRFLTPPGLGLQPGTNGCGLRANGCGAQTAGYDPRNCIQVEGYRVPSVKRSAVTKRLGEDALLAAVDGPEHLTAPRRNRKRQVKISCLLVLLFVTLVAAWVLYRNQQASVTGRRQVHSTSSGNNAQTEKKTQANESGSLHEASHVPTNPNWRVVRPNPYVWVHIHPINRPS